MIVGHASRIAKEEKRKAQSMTPAERLRQIDEDRNRLLKLIASSQISSEQFHRADLEALARLVELAKEGAGRE